MNPKVFSASQLAGLALITAGSWLRFSLPIGLIVAGVGVLVLTFVNLLLAGRR